MPASHGRSSDGAASIGGMASGRTAAGAHEHGAGAGARLAGQVDRVPHLEPALLEGADQGGIALDLCHDDDDLRVGARRERVQGGGQFGVGAQDVGGGDRRRAARRDQMPAQDDDARPLPLLEPARDVTAAGS